MSDVDLIEEEARRFAARTGMAYEEAELLLKGFENRLEIPGHEDWD